MALDHSLLTLGYIFTRFTDYQQKKTQGRFYFSGRGGEEKVIKMMLLPEGLNVFLNITLYNSSIPP